MRYRYFLLFIATIVLFSCKKEKSIIYQPSPPPPSDAPVQKILLKDIEIPNVPSPYYHFEYNADSTISFASFASDLRSYEVGYERGKISEMKDNRAGFGDRLKYSYDNAGRVIAVDYFDVLGTLYIKVSFTYDGQKLIKLERRRILGADLVLNKTMTFSYYADGNLKEIIDHRPAVNGAQDESTTSDRFALYDNKINVDGFGLIHNDFFDQLVLLPGVQFQKNNPGKETFTTDAVSYTGNYTYTYNDNSLPLTKTGDFTVTNGTNAGQTFQTHSVFSYY